MKNDFFDCVSSKFFFTLDENKLLHPIAFFLKKPNSPKYNYKIYNKKLLAII